MKSFQEKRELSREVSDTGGGCNTEVDFHGERRSNDTHVSLTDKDAKLYKNPKDQKQNSPISAMS